ncbi:MAG TPA: hypothetical protein VHW96_17435 [Solirubrobacteraceae bacterium]|jgi:hypothetical protein|nr:hypothetical protein [Solirubrobacteraceae bacterium]
MKRAIGLFMAVLAMAIALTAQTGRSVAAGPTGVNAILSECTSGHLAHSYTLAQLREALSEMSASEKEYTSCVDVINQGILTVKAGKATGSKGGGGSFLPTPVIVILVVLILAAVTFGALAVRRRGGGPGGGPDDGPGGGPDDGDPPTATGSSPPAPE